LAKYAANAMLATRISFMNELSELCEKAGADIELVRAGLGSDARIGTAFLFAGVGYGGSCFPKDVQALIHTGEEYGCPMGIAKAVQSANMRQQDRFAQRIIDHFGRNAPHTILAIWGLAFKAKTNDIRNAPAIRCIDKFLDAGMKVRAYDPEAMPPAAELYGRRITLGKDSYQILDNADALVTFTDWQEFRNPDFDLIAKKLKTPVIFDGRNLCDPAYAEKKGIEYICVGRPHPKQNQQGNSSFGEKSA